MCRQAHYKHLTCNFSQSFPYNQSINMRFFTTDTVAIAKIDFFRHVILAEVTKIARKLRCKQRFPSYLF